MGYTVRRARTAAAVATSGLVIGVVVSACGSTATTSQASCAAMVRFHGHTYWGTGVRKPFTAGARLGRAVQPSCQDSNVDPGTPASQVPVAAIVGVDPADAITGVGDRYGIYVARPQHPPAAVRALVDNPRCSAGRPATLTGSGQLNYDTTAPYPVLVMVQRTDAAGARYAGWTVIVHVTKRTAVAPGTIYVMTHSGPGTVTAVTTCRSGRFVADALRPGGG
jgi:hypothetical protein